jgi:uncharacterized protein
MTRTAAILLLASISLAADAQPVTATPAALRIAAAALAQVGVTTVYDPKYVALRYPGGDLPAERGVCADVVIRALRVIGVDLQREVHEDMRRGFRAYPQMWGLPGPDPNT